MKFSKNEHNIELIPFVAFDLETTGLKAGRDKIVEIGGIQFQDRKTYAEFETLINPGMPMPLEASRINGITDEMLKDQPSVQKVLPNFLDYIRHSVLIAHNASFDMGFVNAALIAEGMEPLKNPVVDTLQLARKVLTGQRSHKLQTLAAQFEIDPGNAHRAKDDAAVCRDVFYKLLELIPDGTTMSLEKLISMAGVK